MSGPILPSASSLLSPAIDAIVAARPAALAHFNNPGSNWRDLPAMWRAQILLNLARLSDEVNSARLRFAKGDSLRTLCASEFNTTLPAAPQPAYATIRLQRGGSGSPGTIKKGYRFSKQADPQAVPLPVASTTYETTTSCFFAASDFTQIVHAVALQPGPGGNVPLLTNYANPNLIQPSVPLFDPTIVANTSLAGGGSSGLTDQVLIAAAKAYYVGQFGPTDGALIAGLLRTQAVRHFAMFPANAALPAARVYMTDESWAISDQWISLVAKEITDNWLGFGCRAFFGGVQNQQIMVAPTIVLKSTDDLANTDDIDANVKAAARSYFDDRPDWYRWRSAALQAIISTADVRILYCSAVTVTDSVTGSPVPEPVDSFETSYPGNLTHYYLLDDSVTSTYLPPS